MEYKIISSSFSILLYLTVFTSKNGPLPKNSILIIYSFLNQTINLFDYCSIN